MTGWSAIAATIVKLRDQALRGAQRQTDSSGRRARPLTWRHRLPNSWAVFVANRLLFAWQYSHPLRARSLYC